MAGFIYVMSNSSMPGLVKIGKSTKDPEKHRINELHTTGVPEPFVCNYYAYVENEGYLEKQLHLRFSTERKNTNREFFAVDVQTVISAIRILTQKTENNILYEKYSYEQKQSYEKNINPRSENYKKQNSAIVQELDYRTAKVLYEQAKNRDERKLKELHSKSVGLAHDWNDRTIKSNQERFEYKDLGSKSSSTKKLHGEFMPEYHERQRRIIGATVFDKTPNKKDD